ncbi:unnamed protein product [Closterium sp. Naga37s-1]|nr:unnamed protein product [Closterium sp. Naga37s-1]
MGHGARPSSFLPHSFPPLSPSLIPFHPPFPPQELGTKSRPFDYIPSCIPRYPLLTPFYPFFGFSPLPLPLPPQELGTKSRPFANIAGVCRRCSEQIAWRRNPRSLPPPSPPHPILIVLVLPSPLLGAVPVTRSPRLSSSLPLSVLSLAQPTSPGSTNHSGACGKRSVKDAYHAICKGSWEAEGEGEAKPFACGAQNAQVLKCPGAQVPTCSNAQMEKGNAGAANSVAKKAAKKAAKGDDSEEDEDDDEEDEWEEDEGEDEGEKDENEGEKDEEGEEDGEDGDGDGGEAGEGKEDEADDSKGGSKGGGTADGTETKKDDYT